MIKKLKQRIFLLIMLSLSIIMIGLIVLYAGLNYNNSINTTVSMMSRFVDREPKRNPNKIEEYKLKPEFNIDGLYRVIIQNSIIVHSPENLRNNIIDEYAIKILKRNNKKGIIDNYIYNVKKIDKNTRNINQPVNQVEEVGKCPNCAGVVSAKYSKRGKLFFGCDNYPKCDYISWDLPLDEKCPICGDNLFKKFPAKGGTQIICNNKGCNYVKN